MNEWMDVWCDTWTAYFSKMTAEVIGRDWCVQRTELAIKAKVLTLHRSN